MLDIKFVRDNPEVVKQAAKNKGVKVDVDRVLVLDGRRRALVTEIDGLRERQNKANEAVAKQEKLKEKNELIAKMRVLKGKLKKFEGELERAEKEYNTVLMQMPNIPASDVKIGKDESENEIIKKVGEPRKFDFTPLDHLEIGERLDLVDTSRAAKVSGARFCYLKNEAATLQFALVHYAMNLLLKEGFRPIIPPVMLKDEMARGSGHPEAFTGDAYRTQIDNLFLVGTSEQSILPMYTNEILKENNLPLRYAAYSTCFRREAGSYGKDTRGIFRVHQFDKLEMFSFCKPEESDREHEYFLSLEEKLMQGLELPYRVSKMCTGDLGMPVARKFDIETWIPSQKKYRETHSASTCTDFQARRLNIKYRGRDGRSALLHTVNGTAFAIGRTLIAILENYQQKDGSVEVPKVLQKYCGFRKITSSQ